MIFPDFLLSRQTVDCNFSYMVAYSHVFVVWLEHTLAVFQKHPIIQFRVQQGVLERSLYFSHQGSTLKLAGGTNHTKCWIRYFEYLQNRFFQFVKYGKSLSKFQNIGKNQDEMHLER